MKHAIFFGIFLPLALNAADLNEPPIQEETSEIVANLDYQGIYSDPALFSSDETAPVLSKEAFEDVVEKQRKYNMFLYGQLDTIFPGGGVAIRSSGKGVGIEGSLSVAFLPNSISHPIFKGSFSLVHHFGSERGMYLGAGGGGFAVIQNAAFHCAPYFPLFVGYEDKRFFADLGVDLVWIRDFSDFLIPIPAFRCGVRF